jgi:hypothetical protein
MDRRYICILIILFIFIFIYLTMMGYTIYKLNDKVNQINHLFVKELDFLHLMKQEKREKQEKRRRTKLEKNIST